MIKVFIKLDIDQDAWNWWDACNSIGHGVDWKTRITPRLRKMIAGKTEKEAYRFLKPYLRRYYADHHSELLAFKNKTRNIFDSRLHGALAAMKRVTKKPIYRKSFTLFITTFPRCPYNPHRGYIWLCATWPSELGMDIFLHELLHFQFIYYWRERDAEVRALSDDKFEFLKESMTVILNDEFKKFMFEKDKGYMIHQDLRRKLQRNWRAHRNFDWLISYGIRQVGG